jgi:putative flippase GtrA
MRIVRTALEPFFSQQFLRFVMVGGIAAVLHWLSRIALNMFMSYAWAVALAYPVGIAVAFVLNRQYVFPHSERPPEAELFYFFLINIAAFPVVWAAAYVLGEWVLSRWLPSHTAFALAHGFAILLPVFVNFVLHKYVTFRGA